MAVGFHTDSIYRKQTLTETLRIVIFYRALFGTIYAVSHLEVRTGTEDY